jgi:predicted secreted protein
VAFYFKTTGISSSATCDVFNVIHYSEGYVVKVWEVMMKATQKNKNVLFQF